jgi:hypothetical protein
MVIATQAKAATPAPASLLALFALEEPAAADDLAAPAAADAEDAFEVVTMEEVATTGTEADDAAGAAVPPIGAVD